MNRLLKNYCAVRSQRRMIEHVTGFSGRLRAPRRIKALTAKDAEDAEEKQKHCQKKQWRNEKLRKESIEVCVFPACST